SPWARSPPRWPTSRGTACCPRSRPPRPRPTRCSSRCSPRGSPSPRWGSRSRGASPWPPRWCWAAWRWRASGDEARGASRKEPVEEDGQLAARDGLLEEAVRPRQLHLARGERRLAEAAGEHAQPVRVAAPRGGKQVEAVQVGHAVVRDDEVEG